MKTAGAMATSVLRMIGAIDTEEQPTAGEMSTVIDAANSLLRAEHQDGASKYLVDRLDFTMPAGASEFYIGTGSKDYPIQKDIVGVRRIMAADSGPFVRREIRFAPMVDIERTTNLGLITMCHQEQRPDGAVRVLVWQRPRLPTKLRIEYGGRIPLLTSPTDVVGMADEGINAVEYLLAQRVHVTFGRPAQALVAILSQAQKYETEWRSWARGQQWIRMLR